MSNKQKLLNGAIMAASAVGGAATWLTVMDIVNTYTDDICKTGDSDYDRYVDTSHHVAAVAIGLCAGCVTTNLISAYLYQIARGAKVVKEVLNG